MCLGRQTGRCHLFPNPIFLLFMAKCSQSVHLHLHIQCLKGTAETWDSGVNSEQRWGLWEKMVTELQGFGHDLLQWASCLPA